MSDRPDAVISTLLGSCVAACLYDPSVRVGGLNHFLLPGCDKSDVNNLKYGINSMELLINSLLRMGASRQSLQAKIFGGAHMSEKFAGIGASNVRFAENFLTAENIDCVGKSVGGTKARRLRFHPATGRAQLLLVERGEFVEPAPVVNTQPVSGNDVDLF
ncbi:MAG: chemotaxis protein CheD [Halocynthiibacter sp.]